MLPERKRKLVVMALGHSWPVTRLAPSLINYLMCRPPYNKNQKDGAALLWWRRLPVGRNEKSLLCTNRSRGSAAKRSAEPTHRRVPR